MLTLIIRWLRGYLYVELIGRSPERFINLCRYHQIYIWKTERCNDRYKFYILTEDYFKVKDISIKTHTYPHINEKIGLPFLIRRLLRKKSLLPCFILFMGIVYMLSTFVWSIGISGQHRHSSEEIIEYLKSIDVHVGMRTGEIDGEEIEKQIRNQYNDISWVSVELKGTNVYIRLMEADIMTNVSDEQTGYSNVVASSDGTVVSMVVRKGTPLVSIGDKVSKGDVLISGIVDLYDDSGTVYKKNPVYADGDIELDVNHRYRDEFYLIHETKQYTGRKQREYIYQYKDRLLFVENVLNKFESYANYDIMYEYIQPKVGKIPIDFLHITKQTTLEYDIVNETYTDEEAKAYASTRLKVYTDNMIKNGLKVQSRNVVLKIKDGKCKATGFINAIEPQLDRQDLSEADWSVTITDEHDGDDD